MPATQRVPSHPPIAFLLFVLAVIIGLVFLSTTVVSPESGPPEGAEALCPDADTDSYADCTVAGCDPAGLDCGDCDDSRGSVHPGATETCDHRDDDCDGVVDEGSTLVVSSKELRDADWTSGDRFGGSLAVVGDVDGDGKDDFVVGAYQDDPKGNNSGSVLLHSGATRAAFCRAVDPDGAAGDGLGFSVAAVGDVDGDAVPDFAAAAPYDDAAYFDQGSLVLFSGADCSRIRKCVDPAAYHNDWLSYAYPGLASVGDLTGDGVPEIVAGAVLADNGPAGDAGKVVVFDGATCAVVRTVVDADPATGDHMGHAVAGIGDVSGDGVPDFAVGVQADDTSAGTDSGSAIVYSGADGALLRKLADPVAGASANLGVALAPATDLDGDGTAELIVGATTANVSPLTGCGRVVVFNPRTGAVLLRAHDPGGANFDHLGMGLSTLPDVNGDGKVEVVAGAYHADVAGRTEAGRILVFSGADGSILARYEDPTPSVGAKLGAATAGIGDVTGDGVPDLLAGAPSDPMRTSAEAGSVILFATESDCDGDSYGPAGGDCDDANVARAPGTVEACNAVDDDCSGVADDDGDGDGYGVCTDCDDANPARHPGAIEICNGLDDDCDTFIDEGADADGDTYAAVCDCDDGNAARHPGAVETCNHADENCGGVDEGYAAVSGQQGVYDPAFEENDQFGLSVAVIGDVNTDGAPDFVVGVRADGGDDRGSVVLFSGATRAPICRAADPGGMTNDNLGTSVAAVGDLDGDGVPDFAASAPQPSGWNAGRVVLFSGASCDLLALCFPPDPSGYLYLGYGRPGISGWIDVTGDGVPEVLAGATLSDTVRGADAGAVYAFSYARATQLCTVARTFVDPQGTANDWFGHTVISIPDLTGDGVADVAVGVPYDDQAAYDSGSVVVLSGANGALVRRMTDAEMGASAQLGAELASVGDLDGDGVADLVAGARYAPYAGRGGAGRVVAFSGRTGATLWRGQDPSGGVNDYLGVAVAGIADIDGDRVPDVVAGAPYADVAGMAEAGRIVLLSGATGAKIRSLEKSEGQAGALFGHSAASIPDLTGDGAPEVLVGAPTYHLPQYADAGIVVVAALESDCDGDGQGLSGGDCSDADPARHAGNAEICDAKDNDCDLLVDEDGDGDGSSVCADCDDADPNQRPGRAELCDGVDNDCDTQIDEGADADGDLWTLPCDCDDTRASRHPGSPETCNHADDDCGGVDEGSVWVGSGARVFDPGAYPSFNEGTSVASIGDVTGDGVPDFAVGAPWHYTANSDAGAVQVYSGASRALFCQAWNPVGGHRYFLGMSIVGIGDATGDGVPDFAASEPGNSVQGMEAGAILLFSGADCAHVRTCFDPAGAAGDHLGDGRPGIAVWPMPSGPPRLVVSSFWGTGVKGPNAGRVVVFSAADCSVVLSASDPYGLAGGWTSVASIADVTGDGVREVAVGSERDATAGGYGSWPVLIFSGSDGALVRRLADASSAGNLGRSIADMGDVDGDGWPEIAAGAPAHGSGRVVVFSARDGSVRFRAEDPTGVAENLGHAIAIVGDLDGDGVSEIVAGAPYATVQGVANAGRVVAFSGAGGAKLGTFADTAPGAGDQLGLAVAGAGDMTGDGAPDALAGAPYDDHPTAGADAGSSFVLAVESDCDTDGQGPFGGDCDDASALRFTGNPEACDSLDNDCDVLVDEDVTVPETCNAADDNCNGLVDEGNPGGGTNCSTGLPGICSPGVMTCITGSATCLGDRGPGGEFCNALDDDCDADIDENHDGDHDGVPDCIDNCTDATNPTQADQDSDAIGDACDCAPANAVNPAPAEVGDTLTASKSGASVTFTWTSGGTPGPYRLYRGWRKPGISWSYDHECAGPATEAPSAGDPTVPLHGTVFYYLVSRVGCGESVLGRDGGGAAVPTTDLCPGAGSDADGDGIEDGADNCPGIFNPSQRDADADGMGDPCDA